MKINQIHRFNKVRKTFYVSGCLECEIPFYNKKIHGIQKYYYKSGIVEKETSFVDGVKYGIEIWYNILGKLSNIRKYCEEICLIK